jgi:hypothetical protein
MEFAAMQTSPKLFSVLFSSLLLLLIPRNGAGQSSSAASGIKMTVRFGASGMSGEQTIYIRGDRKRMDYRNATGGAQRADGSIDVRYGPHIASITRCDLGQMLELNLDAREYRAVPYPPNPFTKEQMEARGIKPQSGVPNEPTLLIETTTVDTDERKEFYGHTARHIITTRKQTPLEGSQSQAQEAVTDGWYIDIDNRISCDQKWPEGAHAYVSLRSSTDSRAPDLPKFVDVGKPETGFAIERKVTTRGSYVMPDGTKRESTTTSEMTATQLEEGPLDAAVFEVPAGFRQVAHIETNPPADWQTAWASAWVRFKAKVERLFD